MGKVFGRSDSPQGPQVAEVDDRAGSGRTALALFDLDDLKAVNQENDFDTGDRLLNAVADVLWRGMPPGAGLERLGNGRLLVWAPDTDLDEAIAMADRLRDLACLVQVNGTDGPVARTVSVGVVAARDDESRKRSILRADVALANAKSAGGNRTEAVRVHPAPSVIPSQAAIADAIRSNALEYHVQPIVRLSDRTAVGVENLLRWNRPDGTIAGPGGFVDTLDRLPESESDLLPGVAIEAARHFVQGADPIYATFNITGAVLDGSGSPASRWLDQLLESLPAEHLVLEIIETAIIVAPGRAVEMLDRLRARGVRIALDDFGTGLSNLERLRCYPFDMLKLDGSFVGNLATSGREEAILAAIVSMSERMGLDLIVEGVETEAQARTLVEFGVRYGQGYHFGRPGPAAHWQEKLRRR